MASTYEKQMIFLMGGSSKPAIIRAENADVLKQENSSHEGWFEFKEIVTSKRTIKVSRGLETLTYLSIREYLKPTVERFN
ncbi:hypothetical protein [Priestia megaterium]|uniref:hypothetical protein n=1 Tax=Priestia megaterium TaxID=1404 RepID=UPI00194E2771|nr:hypothetical protein [Priestia megaterium]MBM6602239.1 hypothetical protein [Priestia megaterium]